MPHNKKCCYNKLIFTTEPSWPSSGTALTIVIKANLVYFSSSFVIARITAVLSRNPKSNYINTAIAGFFVWLGKISSVSNVTNQFINIYAGITRYTNGSKIQVQPARPQFLKSSFPVSSSSSSVCGAKVIKLFVIDSISHQSNSSCSIVVAVFM